MVGEGVLREFLQNSTVKSILAVSRKPSGIDHQKLKELIIPDFMNLDGNLSSLNGYDACFYCAGVSAFLMSEKKYTYFTYETTIHFARTLASLNPDMVFGYVSGMYTDSTEKGRFMWAGIKGKTENGLLRLSFKDVYNFRPGYMKPFKNQKNVKFVFKIIGWFYPKIYPQKSMTLSQLGQAMITTVLEKYPNKILEVADIKKMTKRQKQVSF